MKAGEKIRVLIVDDHAMVRQGLTQILEDTDDITVSGDAGDAVSATRLARERPCDVVVLDISLPDKSGIEVLKQLKREFPKLAVLVVSMHREDQYAVRAIKAGAAGYLNKQSASGELVGAIRQVAAGRKYVTPALAEALVNQLGGADSEAPHERLSDREFQTLVMIASGKTVSEIADELALSVKTVSMYRARLLDKMMLKNNAELTHYAIRNGLVE